MITLPKSVRRFLATFLLASLCAFFSYIAYVTPQKNPSLTLADIQQLEHLIEGVPREGLIEMRRAGLEAKSWLKSCEMTGRSIIKELAEHSGHLPLRAHLPKEDVFDEKTNSQYYFHAHRDAEHGHFHLFLWTDHIPALQRPVYASEKGGFVHLIAISTDIRGYPIRLFTTNQWVTGEDWRHCREMKQLVQNFEISHSEPSWPANRSLTAFVRLFTPQIRELLEMRDQRIAQMCQEHSLEEVLHDRSVDVLSEVSIDLDAQLLAIEAALENPLKKN